MQTIKTLDERIDAAHQATVTVADQLAMSRREVEEIRAALAATTADLEEWRFTNKVDELQRENDRLRASQAESAPVAAVAEPLTVWSMSEGMSVMVPNSPRQAGRKQFYAVEDVDALLAQRAASVEAQPVPRAPNYRFPIGEDGDYEVRDNNGRKVGELYFYVDALTIQMALSKAAQAIPAAGVPHIERDAALKNICAAVDVNDTDSMARLSKDSEVIWTATNSWCKPASVTLGDLRAVAEMAAQQGEKAPGAA